MAVVTIIEVKKANKDFQRSQSMEISLAEKVLRKSKGWTLPEDSKYEFKNGLLLEKEDKSTKSSGKKD